MRGAEPGGGEGGESEDGEGAGDCGAFEVQAAVAGWGEEGGGVVAGGGEEGVDVARGTETVGGWE